MLCVLLSVFLSACASSFSSKLREDSSLPPPSSIHTLADVSSVGFEWKLIQDEKVKGFVVYRSESGEGKGLQAIATIKNRFATHFYDINLNPQSKYIYAFASLGNDDNISPKSEPIHIQTSFIDPVESIFAINNEPRTIKIIWSPHPNPSVDSYLVQRLDKAGKFRTIKTIPHRLGVEYFDTNLNDGQVYTYRIIARSHEGIESKPSQGISVSTIPQPAPIENIQASTDLPRAIEITWKAAPDTQGVSRKIYKISYAREHDKSFKKIATTTQTSYTHKLQQEDDGVKISYQVILLGDNGLEGRESSSPATGSSLPKPSMPLNFRAQMLDNQASLSWDTPTDERIQSFVVYRKEGTIWAQSLRFSNITNNDFVDKEMQKGKKYRYSVVSVDSHGIESTPTQEIELSKE